MDTWEEHTYGISISERLSSEKCPTALPNLKTIPYKVPLVLIATTDKNTYSAGVLFNVNISSMVNALKYIIQYTWKLHRNN